MKIYLGFTVAGDRSSLQVARRILDVLQLMAHEILTAHLVREDAWETDRQISAQEVFARDMTWITECDLFVGEVSGSSFGLGFEAGYLLGATTTKVILFYNRDVERKVSLLITGNTHPNCSLVPYGQLDEIEELVRKFVPEGKLDH